MQTRIAVIQHPPVYLDRSATIARAVNLINEAADKGGQLIVFPEAFVSGYPTWGWRLRPGNDMSLAGEIHQRMYESSVDLETDHLQPVLDVAKERNVVIVFPINEREGRFGRNTLYNAIVTIGGDGTILNRHRKLIATNHERTIWGSGDASGLRVVQTPYGRIGSLLCWESLMPLARMALYAEGVEIFISPTWDTSDGWHATMQHIAREGGCWSIGCAAAVHASDIPAEFPGRAQLFPDNDEWLCAGRSIIMAPFGGPVAGPVAKEKTILFADCDLAQVSRAHRSFDVAGHYNRTDVFDFRVNRQRAEPAKFTD